MRWENYTGHYFSPPTQLPDGSWGGGGSKEVQEKEFLFFKAPPFVSAEVAIGTHLLQNYSVDLAYQFFNYRRIGDQQYPQHPLVLRLSYYLNSK